jgi:hypothetical protein
MIPTIVVLLVLRMIRRMIFANAYPFGIPIGITQQMLPGVNVVLLHMGNVPLGIDGPKDSYFFTRHAGGAVSVIFVKSMCVCVCVCVVSMGEKFII